MLSFHLKVRAYSEEKKTINKDYKVQLITIVNKIILEINLLFNEYNF